MASKSTVKRQTSIRAQRAAKRQKQRRIMAGIIILVVIAIVGIFTLPSILESMLPVGEIVTPIMIERPQVEFNAMGDPNAPVKITEYSDFQCPFCKRFADETEKDILENYVKTGKVYFVYVPYGPGGNYIGEESRSAANAAFCAAEQGKFWEYKDFLFANHTGENVGDYVDKRLIAFAEQLNLDMKQFKDCFSKEKYNDLLQEGIVRGRELNIGGTPSFVFNDGEVTLVGAQPFSRFVQEIEELLNQ